MCELCALVGIASKSGLYMQCCDADLARSLAHLLARSLGSVAAFSLHIRCSYNEIETRNWVSRANVIMIVVYCGNVECGSQYSAHVNGIQPKKRMSVVYLEKQ